MQLLSGNSAYLGDVSSLILILATGYLLYAIPFRRLLFREHEGYTLYFVLLILGVVFYLLHAIFPCFSWLEERSSINTTALTAFLHALLLNIIAMFALYIVKLTNHQLYEQYMLRIMENIQLHFEAHVYQAMINKEMLLITLDNKKTYIGSVLKYTGHESKAEKWLTMKPAFSGYRDETSNTMKISVTYNSKLKNSTERLSNDKFDKYKISFPISRIVSLQNFDIQEYVDVFENQNSNKSKNSKINEIN